MLPDGRRLGAHLPLAPGMVKAVERAHAIGASALQIFGDNPTAWKRRAEPPSELAAFRARLAELDIGPVAVLARELELAPSFAARFVNVHTGSHRGVGLDVGIARLADGVAEVLRRV